MLEHASQTVEMAGERSVTIGPLRLAPLTLDGAATWVIRQSIAGRPCVIVTSNIHHLRLAARESSFCRAVASADLNVADGWPLVVASRLLHEPLPERVAGVDLVARVLQSRTRLRVAILGGPPKAAERLAGRVGQKHDVVLTDPLRGGQWNAPGYLESLRAALKRARANLVLLGIGPPNQEILASFLRPAVDGPIICCGAAIEILAGQRRRAPRPVQRVGLEWAFRTMLEPRRLGPRYLAAAFSFCGIFTQEVRRPSWLGTQVR